MVKNLSAIYETHIQSLGGEDLLEEKMATQSSILTWRIPWKRSLVATVLGAAKSDTSE